MRILMILLGVVFYVFISSPLSAELKDRYDTHTPKTLHYPDIVGEPDSPVYGINPKEALPESLEGSYREELHDSLHKSTSPEKLSLPASMTPEQMAEEFARGLSIESFTPQKPSVEIRISEAQIKKEIEEEKPIKMEVVVSDLVKQALLEIGKKAIPWKTKEGVSTTKTPIETYLIVPAEEETKEETEEEGKKKERGILPVVKLFEEKLIIENMEQEEIEIFIEHLDRLRGVSLSEIEPGVYELKIP